MPLLSIVMSAVLTVAAPGGDRSPAAIARHAYDLLLKPDRRVRTVNPRVASALVEGVARSPTFARLLDALDPLDVIVYVELRHEMPRDSQGRLIFASKAKGQRYVRIQIQSFLALDDII